MISARNLSQAALLVALVVLGGCTPNPKLIEAGLMKPPAPKPVEGAYVSAMDAGFTLPALPEEKIPAPFRRQEVYFPTEEAPGTIIIDPARKTLHYILGKNMAMRYGIAVGREGFEWSGVAQVAEKKAWPTWTPPPEMIARDPAKAKWADGQPGGLTNPLGARAIYLETNGVDYGYRIHGTPEWQSIGRNASSGCIRMINQDVIDLYGRVSGGEKVVVLTRDGSYPTRLALPPPPPKPPAPAPDAPPTPTPTPTASPATGLPTLVPPLNGVPPALQAPTASAVNPAPTTTGTTTP